MVRELRINERIRVREVLVIGEDGERLGVLPIDRALEAARARGLDLAEVAPNSQPPVCRILDYGKYKYEQTRKEREARKHQRQIELREIRLRPKTDAHDIEVKVRTAEKLLREGDKVKITVRFRGREITHADIGRELLEGMWERLRGMAVLERAPSMEGRMMNLILSPIAPKPEPGAKPSKHEGEGEGEGGAEVEQEGQIAEA